MSPSKENSELPDKHSATTVLVTAAPTGLSQGGRISVASGEASPASALSLKEPPARSSTLVSVLLVVTMTVSMIVNVRPRTLAVTED